MSTYFLPSLSTTTTVLLFLFSLSLVSVRQEPSLQRLRCDPAALPRLGSHRPPFGTEEEVGAEGGSRSRGSTTRPGTRRGGNRKEGRVTMKKLLMSVAFIALVGSIVPADAASTF